MIEKPTDSRAPIAEELALGPRLKNLRLRSGLTLEQVAQRAGLEKGYLSRLERSLKRPSISTVLKLCEALGVKLSSLLEENPEDSLIRVIRKKDREDHVVQGNADGDVKSYQIVSPADDKRFLSLFLVKPSATKTTRASSSHSGEEIAYVLRGRLELTIGGTTITADEGDCVHFMAQTEHTMRSIGRAACEVLVVTSPVH
ncbi:helix-turn-helix domain-containing protein [Pseudorhodoferax sp. Leaf265]|uniref:helix-turn-helix domain-containing protein n=1 Tax=Pseudorhodoferax sp. Leaf265 TaxID=1736315 RepID=UPI00070052B0|nr:helix-turn-helix domain-containing protein [Pseudorhodoferax sp. Leaf265]KQP15851.1 hypothetical protein ASF45_04575 [Pseudorhodoferax sp. Leaf265]